VKFKGTRRRHTGRGGITIGDMREKNLLTQRKQDDRVKGLEVPSSKKKKTTKEEKKLKRQGGGQEENI